MKNLAVIFGGKTVEHDISVLTALHAMRHIMDGVKVHAIYMTKGNKMVTGEALKTIDYYTNGKGKVKPCYFMDGGLYSKGKRICTVDCVLNCCHGGIGEGGELAALLKVANIPASSCDMAAALLCQSKTSTRELLNKHNFEQPKFNNSGDGIDFPSIIKPDTLGSSIGISVAKNQAELKSALELAMSMDKIAIVEEYIEDTIEINCSAFYAMGKTWVSKCEVLDKTKTILDFDKKYLEPSGFVKKSGTDDEYGEMETKYADLFIQVQSLTERTYELFNLRGVVRADFLIQNPDSGNPRVILNEINSVPGFLAYHLWARTGIPYGVIIDMICKQAIEDHTENKFVTDFSSNILEINRSLV